MRMLLLFIAFLPSSKPPDIYKKTYYLYNDPIVFKKTRREISLCYYISKQNWVGHNLFALDYFFGDTVFVMPKSILKSIDYFDSSWLKNDSNLYYFVGRIRYGSKMSIDTLRIFMIEKKENTDSILFRRVNRFRIGAE